MDSLDWNTARTAGATLFLAALWTLEGAWPTFIGRKHRIPHYARNAAIGVINGLIVALVFSGLIAVAATFSETRELGLLHIASMPITFEFLIAFVLFDLWQYAWHVMNHKVPFLWRFHCVHHSDAELDASSALRFHTGEIVLSSIARLAVVPILGMTMVHLAVYEAIVLPIVMFHHSNIRIPRRFDQALRIVIVTPWMHWVHHSNYQPETDSNYASAFSLWDRVFRTIRLRNSPAEIDLGLQQFAEAEWRPLRGMLAIPFTHRFREQTKE